MYDAIIVGGGPAGSATAYHLTRAGFAVLLLDRADFPRDKPCGEFFSPPVRGLLSDLGLYSVALFAGLHTIPTATLRWDGLASVSGTFLSQNHPYSPCGGFSLERLVLDNLLWQNAVRAGADARSGIPLRGLLRDPEGNIIGARTDAGEFYARVVIGADGVHSRVARELEVVRPIPRLQKIAIVMHYSGICEDIQSASVEMRVGSLKTNHQGGSIVCGYGPGAHGTANVNLLVPETQAREIAAQGKERYADFILSETFPDVAERLRGATRTRLTTCGTFGHRTTTPIANGVLLVGDAAEFIDPFTGEGVYFALRGAELAAETLVRALKQGDTSVGSLTSYVRARRREFSPKYTVCDLIERAVHAPSLIRWVVPRLSRRPALLNRLLGVTGDMAAPGTLLSPAFLWDVICG